MQRRVAVLAALLVLGACVSEQRPVMIVSPPAAPGGVGLPQPEGARRSASPVVRGGVGMRATGALALPPEIGERPELPRVAAAEAPSAKPPVSPVVRPEPAPSPPSSATPAPVASGPAEPASARPDRVLPTVTVAATPLEPMAMPNGPPLVVVHFAPGSAELSDGARLVLELFARDPGTQRLRRIELWSWASDEDPGEARKIAFASALSVHAYLIDEGIKVPINIGGFGDSHGSAPGRVEIRPGR